jgi:Homing endonuclease associated repeat
MTVRYELEPLHRNTPDADLLDDLKRIAVKLGADTVTIREYGEGGRFSASTLQRRFGSWHAALERAGLAKVRNVNVLEQDLFSSLAEMWTHFGRQPRMADLTARSSRISADTYKRRFRSWRKEEKHSFAGPTKATNQRTLKQAKRSRPIRAGLATLRCACVSL